MRVGFFATASAAVLLIGVQSAAALSTTNDAAPGAALRGALDVDDSDSADAVPAHAPSLRENLLSTPVPAANPSAVQTMSVANWNTTARSVAIDYFDWDAKPTGKGVTIGIVDSGIDLDHAEFKGRVLKGACFGGASAICAVDGGNIGGDPGISPKQETHGTHVAGIAAGATVGIANGASILPVKVCDTYSSSCPGDVNAGIIWASQHGAKIINLSLGGSVLFASDINTAAKAIANGSLLVVAAGNAGNRKVVSGYIAGAAIKPGVRGGMIVVGGTGDDDLLAPFSQTPGATCETSGGVKSCMRDYFVVAPGKGIKSAVGGGKIATMSGTSMSTPYVSGVAALIESQWSNLTPYQVADIIFRTATDLGAPGTDDVYGRGAVNVAAAMAPVGGNSVIAVTGGTNLSTASGNGGAINTSSVGVMSSALHSSALLKSVVLVDVYGRNFSADLSKLAQSYGFSLAGTVRDPFHNSRPFALAADTGALGVVAVSGFVDQTTLPDMPGVDGGNFLTTENIALSVAPTDNLSLDFGHNLNLTGYFNSYDVRASRTEDNVFLSASALNSPYLALADGGDFTGATFAPTDDVRVRFGYAATGDERPRLPNEIGPTLQSDRVTVLSYDDTNRRRASSAVAGMSWTVNSWAGVGLTAARTNEDNSVLGGYTSGAFAIARQAGTTSVGASARANLGDGWVSTLAWNEGVTNLNLASDGLVTNIDRLRSRAYGVALAKRNLFGDDTMGFALSRPMYIYKGGATLHAATGIDEDQNLVFSTEDLSLAAVKPETDVEVGYVARLMGGAVTWQINGAYQMDVNGQPGANAVTAFTRAGFVF